MIQIKFPISGGRLTGQWTTEQVQLNNFSWTNYWFTKNGLTKMPIEQKPTYQVVIEQFVQLSTIEQLVLNTYYDTTP